MAHTLCQLDVEESNFSSGGVTPTTIKREYHIFLDSALVGGLDNARFAAEKFLLEQTKLVPVVDWHYGGLFRGAISVKNVSNSDLYLYKASVTWNKFQQEGKIDPGNPTEFLSGSVSRTTVNRKISHDRIGTYTYTGGKSVDTGRLINVTAGDDPEVLGTDVSVPTLSFNIRRIYPNNTFTIPFLQAAYTFVGRPNSAAWRGFSPGEVMLVGIDGDDSDTEYDNITFSFEASPSEENISIPTVDANGDPKTILVPAKRGFDYLWVRTRPVEVNDVLVEVAQCAYVDQLEEYVDLNVLIP